MNQSNLGCFGFLLIIVALALVWQAVLYIGVPIGVVGVIAAFMVHKRYADDETLAGNNARTLSWVGGTVAALIGLASLTGNIFTEGGPFGEKSEQTKTKTESSSDLIPEMFQGTWASGGNCDYADIFANIDNDGISFGGKLPAFSADKSTNNGSHSVTLFGDTLIADSWANAGYQKDTVTLSLSENGQSISVKGMTFKRCPD